MESLGKIQKQTAEVLRREGLVLVVQDRGLPGYSGSSGNAPAAARGCFSHTCCPRGRLSCDRDSRCEGTYHAEKAASSF